MIPPSATEVRRSVRGALLLARGDAGGMRLFDLSFEGFWASFAGPALAAPLYVLVVLQQRLRGPAEGVPGRTALGDALAYALDVIAFPLLAIALTRFLGLGARYVPLIVATNWAALPQAALFLAAALLGDALPPLRPTVALAVVLATLVYQWFVIRTALAARGGIAAAFLLIGLLVGITLNRLLDAALQAGPPA